METKAKRREVRNLLKDFAIYAKRYYPESKELVKRFQINKETKGSMQHINCIIHMLNLEMCFMDGKSKKAVRGFFHTCRDVMEWVYSTNKEFSGPPQLVSFESGYTRGYNHTNHSHH